MNSFNKVLSSFVSVTTIVWSVGGALLFPGTALAATLNPGDLIKASGPAVYYYGSDGKRYVFPNEKTYFSWYGDFSSVKTITDAELAAVMIGGNVVIRPGTKLVKITTDPKTYAVSDACGMLHWITSEAIAKSLYGDAWATRVVDVPDAFFTDYQVGSAVTTAVHPDGQLVKYSGDSNTYVVMGGQKRKLTSAGISANHVNVANAIETTVTYSNGSDVTGYEDGLGKLACQGQSVASIGNVTATLASDTPAGMTVPNNAASVQLAKFNLATDSNAAVVSGLTIHRVGVGAAADFTNVYLYDANGVRLTTGRTINSSTNTITFNGLNLTIPANSSQAIVVVGDFSTPTATGGQHAFEILDAASVVISGTGTVGGNFPVRGNTFTVGTTSAGTLNVTKGTTPSDPTIGSQDVEISNFKLAASLHDIRVNRIAINIGGGSITASDLTNFKLYQGSTVVASAASVVNEQVTLTFDPAYVISNGVTKVFSLHATVGGRATRTIRTYVEYSTDVNATDVMYNSGAAVNIDPDTSTGTTGFDGGTSQYIEVTTQGGQLTIAFNGPTTGNISKGAQDTQLYKFAITTADNAVTIKKLRFRLELSDGSNGRLGDGTTPFFSDVKVTGDKGGVMGPASLTSTITASGTAFLLTDSFDIPANTTENFVISADLANSSDTTFINKQYKVCLSDTTGNLTGNTSLCTGNIFQLGDVKIVDTGENLAVANIVPNSAIVGNAQTVRASGLTVDLASSPSAGTAVKKQANIPSVGLAFTAGTESNIKVNSIKLTGSADITTAVHSTFSVADLVDVVTSCSLWDGTTQVGTSKSPDAVLGTLNFTNLGFNIDAGATKTLVVKCTADSVVAGSSDFFAIGIAADDDVSAEDASSNTISPTVTAAVNANGAVAAPGLIQTVNNGGVLSVSAGSNPATTIVVGNSAVKFAEFTATAQNEAITVDRITVTSTADAANFSSIAVRQSGATSDAGSAVLPNGENSSKDIALTTPIVIAQDQSATFELWGTLADVKSSSSVSGAIIGVSRSGDSATLGLAYGVQTNPWDANYAAAYNVHGIGGASGDTIYASASSNLNGNAMVIRKSKPVISRLAVSQTTLTTGTDTELYKFQIAPDAAGPIRWKQLEFTVATSAAGQAMTLDTFKLYKGSTPLTSAQVQILDALDGRDITATSDLGSNRVLVLLTTEEVVSGSGVQYTLRATPSFGSATAASISTSFYRSTTAVTGYLSGDAAGTATAFGVLGIDTGAADGGPDGTVNVNGGFLWSDVSEPLHSYSTSTGVSAPGASIDWTNDVYVENMTESQTLSK
ncbi:MAG: hypothetical protein WC477_00090 [Patescibacteria group bacterium]